MEKRARMLSDAESIAVLGAIRTELDKLYRLLPDSNNATKKSINRICTALERAQSELMKGLS